MSSLASPPENTRLRQVLSEDRRNALDDLGRAYADQADARRAIEFYEQALVIARDAKHGDRRGEGNALFNMSLSLDNLGDRVQAIAKAQAALEIYEQIESPYADRVREQLAEWLGEKERRHPYAVAEMGDLMDTTLIVIIAILACIVVAAFLVYRSKAGVSLGLNMGYDFGETTAYFCRR
jgi:tetratricopeptide (TPR) repeat protein